MRVFRVTVAGALVLLAVAAAFGMSVKSDYEKTYDFSQLHTLHSRPTGPAMIHSIRIRLRPVGSRAR
jgi:hypothetical protein